MNIHTITVPYDSGVRCARMGRGPERLREAALEPSLTRLGHTLTSEEVSVPDPHPAEISTTFAVCRAVAERVHHCLQSDLFPIVLSGNCIAAVGAAAGCGCAVTGVVWFDAHGESTTPETTESGFLDGMGISVLTGQYWRKLAHRIPRFSPIPGKHILLIGSRDVERDEGALLDRVGVQRAASLASVRAAMEGLSGHVDGVYVHLDLDVLDPAEAVANHWTPPGGLTVETLRNAAREIRKHSPIKGLGIASYNPELDRERRALEAARLAVEALLGA